MRRRDFIRVVAGGAAVALPASARSQQPAKPVVGYLSIQAIAARKQYIDAFRRGLASEGFVEGQNVTVEYRAADSRPEQLPELAADLVRRKVAAIATSGGPPAALAAKRATETIPIVFASGGDPVHLGFVSTFSRPDKNLTGVYFQLSELVAKRLALLHELLPGARRVALLVNPTNAAEAQPTAQNAAAAAQALGLETKVFNAGTTNEIDVAFATLGGQRPDALFVGPDPMFASEFMRIVSLATRHALPASYFSRDFVEAGGLMSYGPSLEDNQRVVGVYVGRLLKGEKVSDLPVVQPTKYDLIVNLKTLKELGLTVPPTLLARADEVIE